MKIHLQDHVDEAAKAGAKFIAAEAWAAVTTRGRFVMGVSGGRAPWQMFHALVSENMPWNAVHIVQVDERVAPPGHVDRNLTHLEESLLSHIPLLPSQVHAMPVEENDLEMAAANYARLLERIAGSPPVLDLVHLGLGPDGHTASLVPGDPVLEVTDRDVAVTGVYQGRKRMTLTFPMLNRAQRILWLVTGAEKQQLFQRLRAGDPGIPAGRILQEEAVMITDYSVVMGTDSIIPKETYAYRNSHRSWRL